MSDIIFPFQVPARLMRIELKRDPSDSCDRNGPDELENAEVSKAHLLGKLPSDSCDRNGPDELENAEVSKAHLLGKLESSGQGKPLGRGFLRKEELLDYWLEKKNIHVLGQLLDDEDSLKALQRERELSGKAGKACTNPKWVSDSLIHQYLTGLHDNLLLSDTCRIHVQDSFFLESKDRSREIHGVAKSISAQLAESKGQLVLPINFAGNHWIIMHLDYEKQTFSLFDSF
eukprot:Nk52_evm3s386 gene=Nk52_evmTU3s386